MYGVTNSKSRIARSAAAVGVAMVLVLTGYPPASAATDLGTNGTVASRAAAAQQQLLGADGQPLDGRGTSIAIIDTGVDPAHPAFRVPGGPAKIVRDLATGNCVGQPETSSACLTDEPVTTNTDAPLGGHGTFVSGVAVGDDYVLPDGTQVGGNAPGARIVMISATTLLIGVANAFSWVLGNHDAPCGAGVPASTCPPIRVVSASWGTNDAVIVNLERQLVQAGVVVVWANGNDGGDGSTNNSNPGPSTDPTPGVLTVAAYDDLGTGTRDGAVAPSSSRGAASQSQTWPDISAPGVNVVSSCTPGMLICATIGTNPRNGPGPTDTDTYFEASGTSWSAPAVAGIVAMLLQADPAATPAQIDDALKTTAYKYANGAPYVADGAYTSTFDKGTGLVDAYAAALRLGAQPTNGG
ncbi:MAG TPA: S8 family serine peptidase [Pseudonocardiaceae bacterium]|nr:S8 family serine peptidase [Pseudonocardiaceae bacterium]